jgi:hypothetical protein
MTNPNNQPWFRLQLPGLSRLEQFQGDVRAGALEPHFPPSKLLAQGGKDRPYFPVRPALPGSRGRVRTDPFGALLAQDLRFSFRAIRQPPGRRHDLQLV